MTALITNLDHGPIQQKATSQRTNFLFNSLCEFNGKFYGADDNGISEIGGDTDNGEDITGYVKTHKTSLGTMSDKRLRYVYLAIESDGDTKLTVSYSDDTARTYVINTQSTGMQVLRVPIRRKEKGRWIDLKVQNVSGAYFSVNEIDVIPIVLSAGRNRSTFTFTTQE